ncbi:MAG: SufD family Fe-S cluster assembly protein [Novosphingobium sp.]
MSALAAIPTTHDEDWRYADAAVLATLTPDKLANWKTVDIAPGKTQRHTMVVGSAAPELHRIRIQVAEGARAEMFVVNNGAAYTRVEVEVRLAKGAHFEFGGVTIGGGDATREFVTRVDHAEPEATSSQIIRSVHWGQATGNFLGRIEVARDAQKTDAEQNFRAILLEKGASANTKPELEIFADDVKCAHGAAIGQLDQQAAFYMAARGLPPEVARKLLVQAFVADAFTAMGEDGESARLLDTALATLGEAAL